MEYFNGKRIFLTGGTGFFGKSILSMLQRGFLPNTEFVILSRDPKKFLAENPGFSHLARVMFLAGDVRDFKFPTERFDAIIHAAAPTGIALPAGLTASIIRDGTRRVIEIGSGIGGEKWLVSGC